MDLKRDCERVDWIDLAQDMDKVLWYFELGKDPSVFFIKVGTFCRNSGIFISFSTRTVFCGMSYLTV